MKNRQNNLIQGIAYILGANILSMLSGACTGFLLPKYLSVDTYAIIKTYQLYITYCALLHFGFNDGMLLKYGGKNITTITKKDFYSDLSTLRIFQTIIVGIGCFFACFFQDEIMLWAGLSTFPLNIIAYFKNFYQAVGEFGKFSKILNSSTGFMLLANLVLLLGIRTDKWYCYIISYFTVYVIIWIAMEVFTSKLWGGNIVCREFSLDCLRSNVKSGFFLLLGNSAASFMTGMDRMFVKALLSMTDFAMYSFAASMENFLNLAMGSVAVTLYNYFSSDCSETKVEKTRSCVVLFAAILISAAFPLVFIVDIFLNKYNASKNVIIILFAAEFYYTIVLCVYVNLYKVHKKQNKYFFKLVVNLIVGFLLNILLFSMVRSYIAFAIATLVTSFIWMIVSEGDFKQYKVGIKERIYTILLPMGFIFFGVSFDSITGFISYFIFMIVLSWILMNETVLNFIKQARILLKHK